MQDIFSKDEAKVKAFRHTISEARFAKYLALANGDAVLAIELYHWNSLLSQSMYLPLQVWEIALRNKLNGFLIKRYNETWAYDARAEREIRRNDWRKVEETKDRLDPQRQQVRVSPNRIVADLSAGFWVSLITAGYDVPFSWRYNMAQIFPHIQTPSRQSLSEMCDRMLVLRNRVAHHEPILHMDLPALRAELDVLIAGMCGALAAYTDSACTFQTVWGQKPGIAAANDAPEAAGP